MTCRNHPLILIRQGHNHDHVTKLTNALKLSFRFAIFQFLLYRGGRDFLLSEVKFPKEQKWEALTNGVSRPGTAASSIWPPGNLWGLASRGASAEVSKASVLWVEEGVLSAPGGEVYLYKENWGQWGQRSNFFKSTLEELEVEVVTKLALGDDAHQFWQSVH